MAEMWWPLARALVQTGCVVEMEDDFTFHGLVKGTRREPDATNITSHCYRQRWTREWIWLRMDSTQEEIREELDIACGRYRNLMDELTEFERHWPPAWLEIEKPKEK
jgi:hypothetical protein